MPNRFVEAKDGYTKQVDKGKNRPRFFDFNPKDIPDAEEESDSDAHESELEDFAEDFQCDNPQHQEDCRRLSCIAKASKKFFKDNTPAKKKRKNEFNEALELGAHILDLDRDNRLRGKMKASVIKQQTDSLPIVAMLPSVANLHRLIQNLPQCSEKTDLTEGFEVLCDNLSLISNNEQSADEILALNEKTYREAIRRDLDFATTWKLLDKKRPHLLWFQPKTRPAITPTPAANRTRKSSFAPKVRPAWRRPTYHPTKNYPLGHWTKEQAVKKPYQSTNFTEYLVCADLNFSKCLRGEDLCRKVHECMECRKMGHGIVTCPQKKNKQRRD